MNLPNKLTMLRIIMIPFFVFFLLSEIPGKEGSFPIRSGLLMKQYCH